MSTSEELFLNHLEFIPYPCGVEWGKRRGCSRADLFLLLLKRFQIFAIVVGVSGLLLVLVEWVSFPTNRHLQYFVPNPCVRFFVVDVLWEELF